VIAIATDSRDSLPAPTGLPLFELDDAEAIAGFIAANAARCAWAAP